MTKKTLDEIVESARTSSRVVSGTQDWVPPNEEVIIEVAQVIVALKDRLDRAEQLLKDIYRAEIESCSSGLSDLAEFDTKALLDSPFMVNGVAISG